MRTIVTTLCLLGLCAGARAQTPSGGETLSRLSQSAQQELEKSSQELARLREQIAAEKLPLAQQLTAAEENLLQLRREHERVTRLADTANLELPGIKTEIKRNQDDLAYVANLLDEYARTFESKVNVSELQYCGEAVLAAKQVMEESTLSPADKFTRQLACVQLSLKRLFDVIGGLRFPGVGVDLQGVVTEGQFAIIGPVALFRARSGSAAGLVVPQTGSDKPLIRPLEGTLQAGIASLVETGEGLLPLDPSRGGALKALVQKTNIVHVFLKGGPIMWPLALASILALGTVIERLIFLFFERMRRDPRALDRFFAAVKKGDTQEAIRIGNSSKFFVVRALGYALGHIDQSLESAVLYAQNQELKRYRRGIPVLDTIITLAPLLGLLGTIVGMMGSFSLIGGDLNSPTAITGGIAEALIATAFGLGIAITSLLPFNFLNTRMEDASREIESAAMQLELIVQPSAAPAEPQLREVDLPVPAPAPAPRENVRHLELELRRQREALQRQMALMDLELDQRELEMRALSERERGLRRAPHASPTGER